MKVSGDGPIISSVPVLLFLTLLDRLPLALPPAEGLLGDEQPSA